MANLDELKHFERVFLAEKMRLAFVLNCAKTPLDEARAYAEEVFAKAGKKLEEELPNFSQNYQALQKKCAQALDVPRIDMPVIEPTDMKKFQDDLKKGAVDIFAPYARGKLQLPKSMSKKEGEQWITLGFSDGEKKDDKVRGKLTRFPVDTLKPTQSQIWLENMIPKMVKFGTPGPGSPLLNTTVIVSREGFILDGHHRFGQAMLADPSLKMRALYVPLSIKLLLKVGRSYGEALGNTAKE